MKKAQVYWLRLETHSDPSSEGYIGVSTDLDQRISSHLRLAENGKHENSHLLNAIRKSGNNIIQEVVAVGTEEYCYKLEEKLRPKEQIGWNIAPGGYGPPSTANKIWINNGKEHKRIKASELEKYKDWSKGRINVFSDEEKQRRKERYSGKGNPFYGKTHNEATIQKNSEAHMGCIPANACSIKFRGKEFPSIASASRHYNISKWYVRKEAEAII